MTQPLFSLIYTTARPEGVVNVMAEWMIRALDPGTLEWCITRHTDGFYSNTHFSSIKLRSIDQKPFTSVIGWNEAASMSTGLVLVMVADDLVPPMNWDQELMKLTDNGPEWMHGEFVVEVDDGIERADGQKIITHPIMTRAYYERLGYIFPPYYQSMFPDNELTDVARRDGKVICARHLLFEHRHWVNGKRSKDAVDEAQSGKERYEQDRAVYERRKAAGFPKEL